MQYLGEDIIHFSQNIGRAQISTFLLASPPITSYIHPFRRYSVLMVALVNLHPCTIPWSLGLAFLLWHASIEFIIILLFWGHIQISKYILTSSTMLKKIKKPLQSFAFRWLCERSVSWRSHKLISENYLPGLLYMFLDIGQILSLQTSVCCQSAVVNEWIIVGKMVDVQIVAAKTRSLDTSTQLIAT